MAVPLVVSAMETLSPPRALSSESSYTGAADTFSNVASSSSTPPTTVADNVSLASEASKHDNATALESIGGGIKESVETEAAPEPMDVDTSADAIHATPAPKSATATPSVETPPSRRPLRHRDSLPVYNLARLTGTAVHGHRRANGDVLTERRRRTIAGEISAASEDPSSTPRSIRSTAKNDIHAAVSLGTPQSRASKKRAASPEPRRSLRSSGSAVENFTVHLSHLGKRARKSFEMSTEIKKLLDTNEFAHIDTKPVLYTTWAKGKLVEDEEPPKKKTKTSGTEKDVKAEKLETPVEEKPALQQRRIKHYLSHGLYSGQEAPMDLNRSLTPAERKRLAKHPELAPSAHKNKVLAPPIYNGLRLLLQGRDFKLPYDICNPLPPGQPKPEEWRKMTRNRFVGDAAAYWKKTPHFNDYQSKCVCQPEDGCAESCQNRIMLYECDGTNCNIGAEHCTNRAFARLQERIKQGGKYRVGVEVFKTEDRGYGVRSNRCFEPGQIIMEYTGEIITEEECDRRMNEKYKNNKCYYLMSFDQNMIIDATTGSMARFVNHSCQPNCRMIKWIVSGQPRMALFAGNRPIMTGEELTYDYNFDPFSAKNVQKCLCGSANCRGVLGPKPKEVKPPKHPKVDVKEALKRGVKNGKRKLKQLVGADHQDDAPAAKKRKIATAKGVKAKTKAIKKTKSTTSVKAAKNAAKVVKKSVSSISVKAKAALGSKKSKGAGPGSGGPKAKAKVTAIKRKSAVIKTYGKTKLSGRISKPTAKKLEAAAAATASSHKTASTIVAAGAAGSSAKSAKKQPVLSKKVAKSIKIVSKAKKPVSMKGISAKAAAAKAAKKSIEVKQVKKITLKTNSPQKAGDQA